MPQRPFKGHPKAFSQAATKNCQAACRAPSWAAPQRFSGSPQGFPGQKAKKPRNQEGSQAASLGSHKNQEAKKPKSSQNHFQRDVRWIFKRFLNESEFQWLTPKFQWFSPVFQWLFLYIFWSKTLCFYSKIENFNDYFYFFFQWLFQWLFSAFFWFLGSEFHFF